MKKNIFIISLILIALVFTVLFCILIIPPFLKNPDLLAAFGGGFVNPFSSGYSIDVLCCWVILLVWVIYESPKVKHGWICLFIGLIPGVAVGLAVYLILRTRNEN